MENDELLAKAVNEIAANHRKIIDDWCKAYLAQLYEENGSIKPGDFILVESRPAWYSNGMAIKYWFEKRSDENG